MQGLPDSFTVRFANGEAVQKFNEAREWLGVCIQEKPWDTDLRHIQQCLDSAYEGLTFRFTQESQDGQATTQ
jgi:hypothetical protein